ncbi:MAG: NADH-quinone oxidoreductase subunit G [Gammaproteobacteria bacterium]|nr:NADH-quinone oxidoreductase subunit G [Gammaproteobacteria bacterium]
MSDDIINLEINGQPATARKGQMLIEVTDDVGTYVPRFCYHKKLTVAANCRMCLVEVERAPKPLPACATPVTEGMKVYTRSPKAIAAQRATMEFLLINHPLDCPICDQGGECELQDLAMGFGRDVSRFTERKRVVKDKNLGPLVSTDMTRCIHCTRCVRFGQEIAGIQELGTTGRGEHMEIGTYIERSVDHELSGNIIDLCPVGALNNKPYRYSARAWEMTQHAAVSPHDCVGSNMHLHVLRGTVRRVVPRECESINETWLADRDRFSYQGLYAEDRLQRPMIRDGERWRETSWEQALEYAATQLAETLGNDGDHLGVVASTAATLEEHFLLSRLARHLGSHNIDHRLRVRDTRDQHNDPVFPSLGLSISDIDALQGLFVVGSRLRHEAPIIAHRVRKAAMAGARVSFLSTSRDEYLFPVSQYLQSDGVDLLDGLAGVLLAAAESAEAQVPEHLAGVCAEVVPTDAHRAVAADLRNAEHAAVILGLIAVRHPCYADLRALAAAVAELTGASFGQLSDGPNSAGACLAGVLPHRVAGGTPVERAGRGLIEMFEAPRKAYLLHGIEPESDLACASLAQRALESADFNIALTAWDTPALRASCNVLLPIGSFAETSGTFVNVAGDWQSFAGASRPLGESRPGWKVLRVLGNLLDLPDCEYASSEEVRDHLREVLSGHVAQTGYRGSFQATRMSVEVPLAELDVPMYQVDAVLRRAPALQQTRTAQATAGEPAAPDRSEAVNA